MRERGDRGEAAARGVLERAGYFIVAQNFSVRGGEIDIVACAPDGTLAFVEVKVRGYEPIDHRAVLPRAKLSRVRLAARHFLLSYSGHAARLRFDLILLVPVVGARRAHVFWYKGV